MTNQEINRFLALAVGYPHDRVRFFPRDSAAAYVQVLNDYNRGDGPMDYGGWQRFDHRDTAVIWPIAEQFNAFPKWRYNGACEFIGWHCWAFCRGYGASENPATASAIAVIKYVEGIK